MRTDEYLSEFRWHTLRGAHYPDAYWQWLKAAHTHLDTALADDPQLFSLFRTLYTCGWQYEMDIIPYTTFKDALHTAAAALGSDR